LKDKKAVDAGRRKQKTHRRSGPAMGEEKKDSARMNLENRPFTTAKDRGGQQIGAFGGKRHGRRR
jgi:hypothetical protein